MHRPPRPVHHAARFHQHHPALVAGDGPVLHALWHDEHLARRQLDCAVTELDGHLPVDDDEHFVGIGMAVPDELTGDLDQLELVVVHLGDDARCPVIGEASQLVLQVDGGIGHGLGFRCGGVRAHSSVLRRRASSSTALASQRSRRALALQHPFLERQAPAIAAQRAIAAHHAMARHDAPRRGCARRRWPPRARARGAPSCAASFGVAAGLAARDLHQRIPDPLLERGADQVDRRPAPACRPAHRRRRARAARGTRRGRRRRAPACACGNSRAQLRLQRGGIVAQFDHADAAFAWSRPARWPSAVSTQAPADLLALAAGAVTRGRHAELGRAALRTRAKANRSRRRTARR